MIEDSLAAVAERLGGRLQGADSTFRGLSTDSRMVEPGSLFLALRGPNFDGHAFAADALAAGAAAVLVERAPSSLAPAVIVDDSRRALGQLGSWWRRRVAPTVVGVTGSNGKTTVKQMLVSILSRVAATSATRGNLNNDIGVPLTLARLRLGDVYAVVEMGANRPGEIAALAALAQPGVAVVTNANRAHLEGFGSLEQVARAKGELYQALADDGTAVINVDDPHCSMWSRFAGQRSVIDFGIDNHAQVRGIPLGPSGRCRIELPGGVLELVLPVPGRHNLYNALAAAAVAVALGAPAAAIREGLEGFEPPAGRLCTRAATCGARIIDDSYNANPASLEAGADVLMQSGGEPWVALGDMGELGDDAAELHFQSGRMLRERGVRRLYAWGPLSAYTVRGFGSEGRHFEQKQDLIAALEEDLTAGVDLLVKGSRRAGMEAVVVRLCADDATPGEGR